MLLSSSFLHSTLYLVILYDIFPSHLVESVIVCPEEFCELKLVLSLSFYEVSIGFSQEGCEEVK